MPIDEAYKTKDLKKLLDFKAYIEPIIKEEIENIDEDDLEFGYSFEKELDKNLWDEAVEQNNYYDVKTEILEHHDGVYLKSTFVKLHMRTLLIQELAYSTYCSLKYLSGQGYLFQESQQSG